MSAPLRLACIGEIMVELIAHGENQASLGVAGDTYNTAVYLRRLSGPQDLEITYVTALGADGFSDRILNEIEKCALKTSHVEKRHDMMPGLYAIETDEKGERSFSYWRGQSAAKTLFSEPCEIKLESLCDFNLIYLSGISLAILPPDTRQNLLQFLKKFRGQGGKVAFDSNYRPKLWESQNIARDISMSMWALTDIALPSLDDEMALFGDTNEKQVLSRLETAGVYFGALKRAEKGPVPISFSEKAKASASTVYPLANQVVDTTAAGDSFNAGFLSAYLAGRGLPEAMMQGHKLAAHVIQAKGAIVPL